MTEPTARHRPRVAANPIPYWARDGEVDKSKEVFDQAFADFAAIGFTAVKADVPEGMTAADYADWIAGYGLAPSLSLFSSPFDETIDIVGGDRAGEALRRRPGRARAGPDDGLLDGAAGPDGGARGRRRTSTRTGCRWRSRTSGIVCQALQRRRPAAAAPLARRRGVRDRGRDHPAAGHPGPDVIGFGPDTGHLRWAGIDPAALIRRYADRIGGIHIKDCFPDYLDPAARRGLSYHQVGGTKRLWAEPGRGVVDFEAVVAAMPDRLRRRLHDRGRRAERGVAVRLAPDVLRPGPARPSASRRSERGNNMATAAVIGCGDVSADPPGGDRRHRRHRAGRASATPIPIDWRPPRRPSRCPGSPTTGSCSTASGPTSCTSARRTTSTRSRPSTASSAACTSSPRSRWRTPSRTGSGWSRPRSGARQDRRLLPEPLQRNRCGHAPAAGLG